MNTAKNKARPSYYPARRLADMTPGKMLKTVRKLQEMSQAELAHASGVGQATISAMEHERTAIGADRARKLARALHVHPAVLVFPEWEEEEDDSMRGSEERDIRTPRAAPKKPAHRKHVV